MDASVGGAPPDILETSGQKRALRVWLRLLTCSTLIERDIRARFRKTFGITLPRFDALSALDRAPRGLTMGQLSQRLMVSNGNVTGIADRLEKDGLISRAADPDDRRSQVVELTDEGRHLFSRMAIEHEKWIRDLFAGLSRREMDDMMDDLDQTKATLAGNIARESGQ